MDISNINNYNEFQSKYSKIQIYLNSDIYSEILYKKKYRKVHFYGFKIAKAYNYQIYVNNLKNKQNKKTNIFY